MTTNELELAWSAGLFDGEGCCAKHTQSGGLIVCINQAHPEVLERFRDAVGIGNVNGPYLYAYRKKAMYDWRVFGTKSTIVLRKLWPYLSSQKKEQAIAKGYIHT